MTSSPVCPRLKVGSGLSPSWPSSRHTGILRSYSAAGAKWQFQRDVLACRILPLTLCMRLTVTRRSERKIGCLKIRGIDYRHCAMGFGIHHVYLMRLNA